MCLQYKELVSMRYICVSSLSHYRLNILDFLGEKRGCVSKDTVVPRRWETT